MIYKSSKGRTIRLTSKVGSGGEGDIYLIDGDMKYVAKIYNDKHKPNIQKQNKLTFMLNSSSNINLLNYVCMPVETLSLPKSGEIVGFIMQNLTGWVSIFNLYHPSLRKEKFPDIQWDFLLNVARNIAAAFDEIHLHEYIIGDVNESGIMIEGTVFHYSVGSIKEDIFSLNLLSFLFFVIGFNYFLNKRMAYNIFRRKLHDTDPSNFR